MVTRHQQPAPARTRARLVGQMALQDAMLYARMNVRELAIACGKEEYKHTISHLRSGTRNTCSAHLATRIELALRVTPRSLFTPFVTRVQSVPTDPKVAQTSRGRRKAA